VIQVMRNSIDFVKGTNYLLNVTEMSYCLVVFQSLCYTTHRMAQQARLERNLKDRPV